MTLHDVSPGRLVCWADGLDGGRVRWLDGLTLFDRRLPAKPGLKRGHAHPQAPQSVHLLLESGLQGPDLRFETGRLCGAGLVPQPLTDPGLPGLPCHLRLDTGFHRLHRSVWSLQSRVGNRLDLARMPACRSRFGRDRRCRGANRPASRVESWPAPVKEQVIVVDGEMRTCCQLNVCDIAMMGRELWSFPPTSDPTCSRRTFRSSPSSCSAQPQPALAGGNRAATGKGNPPWPRAHANGNSVMEWERTEHSMGPGIAQSLRGRLCDPRSRLDRAPVPSRRVDPGETNFECSVATRFPASLTPAPPG